MTKVQNSQVIQLTKLEKQVLCLRMCDLLNEQICYILDITNDEIKQVFSGIASRTKSVNDTLEIQRIINSIPRTKKVLI